MIVFDGLRVILKLLLLFKGWGVFVELATEAGDGSRVDHIEVPAQHWVLIENALVLLFTTSWGMTQGTAHDHTTWNDLATILVIISGFADYFGDGSCGGL